MTSPSELGLMMHTREGFNPWSGVRYMFDHEGTPFPVFRPPGRRVLNAESNSE